MGHILMLGKSEIDEVSCYLAVQEHEINTAKTS